MTVNRQGQAPYGGDVPPAGEALRIQEEFQSGPSPSFRPGYYQWPTRWAEWNPPLASAISLRFMDATLQRALLLIDAPINGQGVYQYAGNVLPFPALATFPFVPLNPEDPEGDALAWFTAFAGLGFGPTQAFQPGPLQVNLESSAALVISGANLATSPDDGFNAFGLRQHAEPIGAPAVPWQSFAFAQEQLNSTQGNVPDLLPVGGAMGLLVRVDILIEREVLPTEYGTQLVPSVSTDGGASWILLTDSMELKGGALDYPRSIGFGASGYIDTLNVPAFQGNPGIGSFDWLRLYAQPVDEASIIRNPNGGRNWP